MIQLLSKEQQIIFEIEQSEMFPDYTSVLKEAIAKNIDLRGLLVESKNIDHVSWKEVDLSSVYFKDCSMKRNEFHQCKGDLHCKNCDLTKTKIKNAKFSSLQLDDCNISHLIFDNTYSDSTFISSCNLQNASFYHSDIAGVNFIYCNLNQAIFKFCKLQNASFFSLSGGTKWYEGMAFISCQMNDCRMPSVDDISLLYFWEVNLLDSETFEDISITEITNNNSKVLYAIDEDVVWWKPYPNKDEESGKPFRHSLSEFIKEVEAEFPTTGLYPCMEDFVVEDELIAVCEYLKLLKA